MEKERRKKNKPRKIKGRGGGGRQVLKLQKLIITTSSRAGTLRTILLYFPDARSLLVQRMHQKWCLHLLVETCQGKKQKTHAYIYNRLWWMWNKNSKPGNLHILQEWSFHSLTQVKYVIQKDFLMGKSKQSGMEIKWSELIILPTWDAFRHLFGAGEPDKTKYSSTNANNTILKQRLISYTFNNNYACTRIYT